MPTPLNSNSRSWALRADREINSVSNDIMAAIGAEDLAVSVAYLDNAKAKLVAALEAIISAKVHS